MNISEKQNDYLENRKRLLRSWRYVGPVLLLGMLGFVIWLYVNSPLLINPFEIISRIESGTIEQSTFEMMAVLLPIAMIFVIFLLFVNVAMVYVAFSHEKKHLDIVSKLDNSKTDMVQ